MLASQEDQQESQVKLVQRTSQQKLLVGTRFWDDTIERQLSPVTFSGAVMKDDGLRAAELSCSEVGIGDTSEDADQEMLKMLSKGGE